jgi:hypothetical protein
MKKFLLSNFSLLFFINSYTQILSFTLANPQPNLMESWAGTFAIGDIDGDGDVDLFMTGITPQSQTKLYINNGVGSFSEATHNFPRSSTSQAIFKDLDNDGDLDLFFSGINQLNQTFVNIYRNNGAGIFTLVTNTLPLFSKGAAIDDVDNDGDQDIAITTSSVANIYLNNGNAFFTPQANPVFTPVSGVVQFIDMENDGDKDVIVSGASSTKLYKNNGSGIFTLDANSTLPAISGIDIDVADTDNDGDFDFLINGSGQNLLYTNNGSGVFTQTATSIQQTSGGANALTDMDNDGDSDMLIVGTQAGGLPNIYNILYRNAGNNIFIPVDTLGGEYIADCVINDFNGDGLKDIIIQGFAFKTNVYWNTSNITLPLQLLNFSGKVNNDNIVLNWTTKNELNTDYFIIERSNNGLYYSYEGTTSSMNTPSPIHNYQYQVKNTVNGTNYFRLKMVDKNGRFTYSNILAFRPNAITETTVYPTVTNSTININTHKDQKIELYNTKGQYVQNLMIGQNDISHLPTGIYFVKTNEKTIRIIKQ